MAELVHHIEQSYLACKFKKNTHFLVGVSGGVDSMVLAHTLIELKKNYSIQLSFIYIDHQLNSASKQWGQFVQKFAKKNKVECFIESVSINHDLKLGIEGAARKHRYQAFAKHQKDVLVLAHHEDDQFETFILQLSRGSGLKGLSCMAELDSVRQIWRPLLNVSKANIISYQNKLQLGFINDDSNLNNKFDRNYIRNKVIPVIKKRFPMITMNANRSIQHIADHYNQQKDVIEKIYKNALTGMCSLNGDFLKKLDDMSLAQLIRFWLGEHQILMPSTRVMNQIIKQVKGLNSESRIKIRIQEHTIQSYNQQLFLVADDQLNFTSVIWKKEDQIKLQDNHFVISQKITGEGISKNFITNKQVLISKPRTMTEKIKVHAKQPSRDLKYLFQEHKIPAWERSNYPCVYIENRLVAVLNIGIDDEARAKQNEEGYVFTYKKPQF